MATDYFQDFELYGVGQALPSPSDTPYQTPMVTPSSRRFSRKGTPMSSSPPPLPLDSVARIQDVANDEGISVLDPRKFTPTLHASLVSEILSLRRELESKHKFIENLEINLQTARAESDLLNIKLLDAAKEGQSVRWQLQQLETGTLAIMEDLAKERDNVKMANTDLRSKLEASERKVRGLEDDADRNQTLWEMDKEAWTAEKRSMERRVHVAEVRLKSVLDEVAARNEVSYLQGDSAESEDNDDPWDSGLGNESDTNSVQSTTPRKAPNHRRGHCRTISNNSHRSFRHSQRYSVLSGAGSEAHARANGLSLADELKFDEEEEDYLVGTGDDEEEYPRRSPVRARRTIDSRQSIYQDEKAKRILGIVSEERSPTFIAVELGEPAEHEVSMVNRFVRPHDLRRLYVDAGVQFSPPSPPPISMVEMHNVGVQTGAPLAQMETGQPKQHGSIHNSTQAFPQPIFQEQNPPTPVVSSACQTMEQSPDCAVMPRTPASSNDLTVSTHETRSETNSASTQTELLEKSQPSLAIIPPPSRAPPPPPLIIPSIAIHPPSSAPSSPKEAKLPPGTKNVSCQTTSSSLVPMRSVSMQTEEIRIDQRRIKLPPHLLPSTLDSILAKSLPPKHQLSPSISILGSKTSAYPWRPDDIPSSPPTSPSVMQTEDRYPGNNDNGPLVLGRGDGIRRPFRSTSLFAGFDDSSTAEVENADEANLNEDIFKPIANMVRTLSSRTLKHVRPFANPPTPISEDKEVASNADAPRLNSARTQISGLRSARGSPEKPARVTKPLRTGSISRQPNMRRAAMIQSGAAAHLQNRSRSPSLGSIASSKTSDQAARPPFPVPARSSSRSTFTLSRSEGAQSPTPRSSNASSGRRLPPGKQTERKDNLRKVRSVAAVPRHARNRSQSPIKKTSNVAADSHLTQSLEVAATNTERTYIAQRLSDKFEPSNRASLMPDEPRDSSDEHATVVDAIAATMVGEWMWKYRRRRNSFGVQEATREVGSDASISVTGNGVRHKRWVWLSPYERSVMWNNKQPTSGSALMGRSGRKLMIKSVLDVADNTPHPKGAGPGALFNRSIIILTPTRALKFTAVSQERHYLWLTALSFLAHSPHGSPELTQLPAVPELDPEQLQPTHATLRPSSSRSPAPFPTDDPTPSNELRRHASNNEHHIPTDFDKSASPPAVPRYSTHGRKRSSTGPRLPPLSYLSLRSFSSTAPSSSTASSSIPSSLRNSFLADSSGRNSEANSSVRNNNFFDAVVGTVRMEAFVEARASEETAGLGVRGAGGRRRNGGWSGGAGDRRRSGVVFGDDFDALDPFREF